MQIHFWLRQPLHEHPIPSLPSIFLSSGNGPLSMSLGQVSDPPGCLSLSFCSFSALDRTMAAAQLPLPGLSACITPRVLWGSVRGGESRLGALFLLLVPRSHYLEF